MDAIPNVGAVFSADIAVPEHQREMRFYSRVLSTGADPLWREDLMNNLGVPVIGLGERTGEYAALPLQWMPHVQVASVAASVQRALELGGSELMHGRGEDGESQWAVLLDPNGAAFGVIPAIPLEDVSLGDGLDAPGAIGRITWLDLTIPAATATRDFYREVVGWSIRDVEMGDGGKHYTDYAMLGPDGTPIGGVRHSLGVNAGLPPVWMIYLPVGDIAESLRRAEEEGGKVIKSLQEVDGKYVYAAIQDPVGACFAVVPASA
jgi:predicted enzyme related to lactoylglutathione lyase